MGVRRGADRHVGRRRADEHGGDVSGTSLPRWSTLPRELRRSYVLAGASAVVIATLVLIAALVFRAPLPVVALSGGAAIALAGAGTTAHGRRTAERLLAADDAGRAPS